MFELQYNNLDAISFNFNKNYLGCKISSTVVLQVALHMRATRTFTDKFGTKRKNGEEWLIKMEDTDAHIPDVYEEVSYAPCSNYNKFRGLSTIHMQYFL